MASTALLKNLIFIKCFGFSAGTSLLTSEGGAHQMPQEDVPENVSLKDVFIQLNTIKREIDQNFNSLRTNVELLNHELKSDMKELRENVIDKSLENAWKEEEESKSNMASVYEEIETLKEEINVLREKLEHQRQRNIQLDQYSRRENIRFVNVNEEKGKIQQSYL